MKSNLSLFIKDHGEIIELSRRTRIHRNTISSYLNEERAPRLDNAYKIAKELNKSVYEIWPPE